MSDEPRVCLWREPHHYKPRAEGGGCGWWLPHNFEPERHDIDVEQWLRNHLRAGLTAAIDADFDEQILWGNGTGAAASEEVTLHALDIPRGDVHPGSTTGRRQFRGDEGTRCGVDGFVIGVYDDDLSAITCERCRALVTMDRAADGRMSVNEFRVESGLPPVEDVVGVTLWPAQQRFLDDRAAPMMLPLGHHTGRSQTLPSEAIRQAIDKTMSARYEPVGLVLHPLDHARVGFEQGPKDETAIEAMKRVADSFGVPYWTVNIPGYPPPFKVRARRHWRRFRAAGRRIFMRLPGVNDYVMPDSWEPVRYRRGRWWLRVGKTVFGYYRPDEWGYA